MSFKYAQDDVDKWTGQFKPQYWPPFEILAHLIQEVGEVGREISHLHGIEKKKEGAKEKRLGQELADVLFTICCMANSNNINLDEEWKIMFENKMNMRDKNRFEKK